MAKPPIYNPTFDPTFGMNAQILAPPVTWMELKCKRPNLRDSTRRRDEIVIFMPRCAYKTVTTKYGYLFQPLHQPQPQWVIPRSFIVGSFVLENFTLPHGGESLFMWDVGNQESWREGEPIFATDVEFHR